MVKTTFSGGTGERAGGNGELIEAMARVAEEAGRRIAPPEEAREIELTAQAFSDEWVSRDAAAGAHVVDLLVLRQL